MKIEDWLSNLGLIEYISIFKENEITFEDLNSLSSEDLKTELGITKLIDREDDEEFIQYLKECETKDSDKRRKRLEMTKKIQKQNKDKAAVSDKKKEKRECFPIKDFAKKLTCWQKAVPSKKF